MPCSFRQSPKLVNAYRTQYFWLASGLITMVVITLYVFLISRVQDRISGHNGSTCFEKIDSFKENRFNGLISNQACYERFLFLDLENDIDVGLSRLACHVDGLVWLYRKLLEFAFLSEMTSVSFCLQKIERYFTPHKTRHTQYVRVSSTSKVDAWAARNVGGGRGKWYQLILAQICSGKSVVEWWTFLLVISYGYMTCN